MSFVKPFGISEIPTEGDFDQKSLLGGKGAGLHGMTKLGIPVPPGIVITTEAYKAYRDADTKELKAAVLDALMNLVLPILPSMSVAATPIVSVRSGAPVSMPGMMDTILNVGIEAKSFGFWCEKLGRRTVLDSSRRLVQMIGTTVFGIDADHFEACLSNVRSVYEVATDADLTEDQLRLVLNEFVGIFEKATGKKFPATAEEQIRCSIEAVFKSWDNDRAIEYRKMQGIDESMGTAVVIQTMVFGNAAGLSGSGVLFTRNPSSGEDVIFGEFLPNAQGEDVVAGIRTPLNLKDMHKQGGEWAVMQKHIEDTAHFIEQKLGDVQDIEFTIQNGTLYVLQTRSAKRTAAAAVKIATDFFRAGQIDEKQYVKKITSADFAGAQVPSVSPMYKTKPHVTGLAASSGVVTGKPVFTAEEAVKESKKGPVVLVREMTDPDDLAGMAAAVAVVTDTGGATCHAAVVARAIGRPCVVGCGDAVAKISGATTVTVDGTTGRVWVDSKVPVTTGNVEDCEFFIRTLKKVFGASIVGSDAATADLIIGNDWIDTPALLDARMEQIKARTARGEKIKVMFALKEADDMDLGFLEDMKAETAKKLAMFCKTNGIEMVKVGTWAECENADTTLSSLFAHAGAL